VLVSIEETISKSTKMYVLLKFILLTYLIISIEGKPLQNFKFGGGIKVSGSSSIGDVKNQNIDVKNGPQSEVAGKFSL